MRSILITAPGEPDVLTVGERDVPDLRAGYLRLRVSGAAVNPVDAFLRSGGIDAEFVGPLPWTPGMDAAGVVESVNSDSAYRVGERVMAVVVPGPSRPGAQSELVLVPETSVMRVPFGMNLIQAASLPMNGLTALLALDEITARGAGTVAVTGATGMLGLLVVELAHHLGLHVVAAGRRDERQILMDAGANEFVERGPHIAQAIRALHPLGVDAAVDASLQGPETVRAIRDGGLLVAVRSCSHSYERDIEVVSVMVAKYARDKTRLERLRVLIGSGVLTPRVSGIFAPEEIVEVHRRMEVGGVRGRLMISFES